MTLEIALMEGLQKRSGSTATLARVYSGWGEHARGWIGLGLAGAALDAPRRPTWAGVAAAAFLAHGTAVVTKRVVRRPRPSDPRLAILVPTPSDLSFPSAHVSSTTAAAAVMVPVVGVAPALGLAGAMAFARVSLGVHYPSDVAAGAAVGLVAAAAVGPFVARAAAR